MWLTQDSIDFIHGMINTKFRWIASLKCCCWLLAIALHIRNVCMYGVRVVSMCFTNSWITHNNPGISRSAKISVWRRHERVHVPVVDYVRGHSGNIESEDRWLRLTIYAPNDQEQKYVSLGTSVNRFYKIIWCEVKGYHR